mgnify:CR=1 FL=1
MIIVDNSVLSAFKRLKVLDLLRQLFGDIMITPSVLDEFSRRWGREVLPKQSSSVINDVESNISKKPLYIIHRL